MSILKQAQDASKFEDQTDVKSGGYSSSEIPLEGKWPARFISYIEMGVQDQGSYLGKPKPPAEEVNLTFEVFGGGNTVEIVTEDGEKVKVGRKQYDKLAKKLNSKSKFYKYFQEMLAGRTDIKHMAEMLDEVFYVTIKHTVGKNGKTYANIEKIEPPLMEQFDPETGAPTGNKIDITAKVPPASAPHRLLLQDNPTIEQWKSIEIEGTRKVKRKDESGNEYEEEVSNNFLQERVLNSLSFKGSALELFLSGCDVETTTHTPEETTTTETDDPLAALGI